MTLNRSNVIGHTKDVQQADKKSKQHTVGLIYLMDFS